jgi:hypothetical protein
MRSHASSDAVFRATPLASFGGGSSNAEKR